MHIPRIGLLCVVLSASFAHAQGTKADYERAEHLADTVRDKVFHADCDVAWLAGGKAGWYRTKVAPNETAYVRFDAATGEKKPLFDADRLAESLTKAAGKPFNGKDLGLERLQFDRDESSATFTTAGTRWKLSLADYTVTSLGAPPAQPRRWSGEPRLEHVGQPENGYSTPRGPKSPDGKYEAFVRENNVYVRDTGTKAVTQLSFTGSTTDSFGDDFAWSPDSKKLVAIQTRDGYDHKVNIVQSSPADQIQPKLVTLDYRKAGDDIPLSRPRLFDIATKKLVTLDESLNPNPWSIDEVRWAADSKTFTFEYNQRGHQILRVIEVDAALGTGRAVVEEKTDTHLAYNDKYFCEYLADGNIVWMSERSGWNHLYLYDGKTGKVKNPVTSGNWAVRRVIRLDEKAKQIWFVAYSVRPGEDPLYTNVGRVNFDGTGLTWLTTENATHDVTFAPDMATYVDTYSRLDLPPVSELRKADGTLIATLEKADISKLTEAGWKPPIQFITPGRDDTTPVAGTIMLPSNFDPAKKYPVIEDIYMGMAIVPKKWAPTFNDQKLAELGFVVVTIDPMVTIWPSRKHWDTGYRNLGDGGFPDRIKWIKAAAEKYPFMDLDRVGIFGTSAGGQAALRGLLAHGDFYKAGVASCGCHDNRMDKIWWNEYWMGWPIGPWYAEQSNVTNAAKLQGKLLLMVGELDDNVDPASTMQVADALIKADKDFEFVVLPNEKHTAGGAYGERRRRDFFVRSLLGVEPRR